MCHAASKAGNGKQLWAGKGRSKRNDRWILDGVQDRKHQLANIHIRGFGLVAGDFRLVEVAFDMLAHIIAGAGARNDQSSVFKQIISLKYSRWADSIGATGMAY